MTEDCPAIKLSYQENRHDELPPMPQWTRPAIKAQRDHRKKNFGYAIRQTVSLRELRLPILPLVNPRGSEFIHHSNDDR
jgi:hypothetical protein